MDNLFITQHFDWDPLPSRKLRWLNRLLAMLGSESRVRSPYQGEMTSIEQRINLFHLLSQVLEFGVAGDVVEVGAHAGVTATLFTTIITQLAPDRRLHLFDAFLNPTEADVLANFAKAGLPAPDFHRGWIHETLRDQLPEPVAFFHIDLGPGRSADLLADDVGAALAALYPRMPVHAVGVIQDYCDPSVYDRPGWRFPGLIHTPRHWNQFPQVKRACDDFFADKPEQVYPLYGGIYSHGYFRKLHQHGSP